MNLLKIRKIKKRKKPEFLRCNAKNLKRLGEKWRRPKGKQNKLRRHFKSRGHIPSPGYGSPKDVKGLHPCGLEEIIVRNINDVMNVDPEKNIVKIARTVGKKKKMELIKIAEENKIKIANIPKGVK